MWRAWLWFSETCICVHPYPCDVVFCFSAILSPLAVAWLWGFVITHYYHHHNQNTSSAFHVFPMWSSFWIARIVRVDRVYKANWSINLRVELIDWLSNLLSIFNWKLVKLNFWSWIQCQCYLSQNTEQGHHEMEKWPLDSLQIPKNSLLTTLKIVLIILCPCLQARKYWIHLL